jgi:hypothetical protein
VRRRGLLGLALAAPIALPRPAGAATDERLGVYRGAGCDGRPRVAVFGQWLGRSPGWVIDFLNYADAEDPLRSGRWILPCWRGAPFRLSLAIPLLPRDGSGSLAEGARGAYDQRYRDIAALLLANDRADAVLRIGWEMNGDWMPWNAAPDPAAYIAYWRRVAAIFRDTPGARFRLEWAPTLGRNTIDPERAYPGDDAVDLIGMSVYNQSWTVPTGAHALRWLQLRSQPNGLDWHRRFAAAHGKPRSFPEWGTGQRPDGSGGGDDGFFVEAMADWLAAPDIAYYGYWDYPAPDYRGIISSGEQPAAAKAFRGRFGG